MAAQQEGLERDAIGLTEVLFQSITYMAPAVAVALSIGFATTWPPGSPRWRSCSRWSPCCSRRTPSASWRAIFRRRVGCTPTSGRGLGSYAGWLSPGRSCSLDRSSRPLLFAAFGFFGAALLTELFGYSNGLPVGPVYGALRADRLVPDLPRDLDLDPHRRRPRAYRDRHLVLVVSALLVSTPAIATRSSVFIPGDQGIQPALQGMVFCLLAFVGFEAAAPLAEETRDPKRNDPSGHPLVGGPHRPLLRVLLLRGDGLLRPGQDGRLPRLQRRQPVGRHGQPGPARHRQPASSRSRSSTAASPTPTRAQTRRPGRSSRSVGRGSSRRRSPRSIRPTGRRSTAIHLQASSGSSSRSASACTSATRIRDVPGPLNTYFAIGYAIGLLFAGMYMAVNLATIGYYWREQRPEFNWLKHLLVPIIGFILMIPAFLGVARAASRSRSSTSSSRRSVSRTATSRRSSGSGCSSASSSGSYFWCPGARQALAPVGVAMGETEGEAAPAAPAT